MLKSKITITGGVTTPTTMKGKNNANGTHDRK
nr:hypothetical protein [uncultured Mediterranean phage uvMED]